MQTLRSTSHGAPGNCASRIAIRQITFRLLLQIHSSSRSQRGECPTPIFLYWPIGEEITGAKRLAGSPPSSPSPRQLAEVTRSRNNEIRCRQFYERFSYESGKNTHRRRR